MGLDMYARACRQAPRRPVDFDTERLAHDELFYWRKHPDLHGWMEALYREKGGRDCFNCVPVVVTTEDLDRLEADVRAAALPNTAGFFFGHSTPENRRRDLDFIARARQAIADGKTVFYTSWW